MSVDNILASGRRAALARMTSTAAVRRKTGSAMVGDLLQPTWTTVATVPCRLSNPPRGASTTTSRTVGDLEIETATRTLSVPVGTPLQADDFVQVTVGELAGHVFRVIEATAADQQTALRVPVISTQAPQEWT